ncbi:MAG: YhgE/Pip domain-containing protein [Paenibacillaceae bacterium]|nr:YhgE/Pip domain-containing protein [Paenibacillaceae bacterium]
MKPIRWLLQEWKSVVRSPKTVVPLLGILLIPMLYSGTYLWAFWDPYARMEKLPVAVVNEDRSVVYEGKTFAIGDELVAELKKDAAFDWHFVDRAEAEQGLMRYRYYFEVVIPDSFSQRATTIGAAQPTPLELVFKANEGVNYSVSRIGQTGVETIRQKLSQRLIESYAEGIFAQFEEVRGGMRQAADGARELAAGAAGADNGARQLADAAAAKQPAVAQLAQGAQDAASGAARLAAGAQALQSGAGQLSGGLAQLGDGLKPLQAGGAQLAGGLTQAADGAGRLEQSLGGFAAAHPELAKDAALQALQTGGKQLAAGAAPLVKGAGDLSAGLGAYAQKQAEASAGGGELAANSKELTAGAASLQKGSESLAQGTKTLSAGWSDMTVNLQALEVGLRQLADGGAKLADSLSDGADRLAAVNGAQPLYAMLANPVHLREESVHRLPNYGTGMAPFFISVSLYVGALLLSTVFPMRDTAQPAPSAGIWFVSKFAILAALSLGQVIVAALVLTWGVGLQPLNAFQLVGFMFVCSLAFMALIQLLVAALDNVGRFIGILLLVLQLTATSGTFPVELVPTFLRTVHAYLPITYTVEGLRAIISTGDTPLLWRDAGVVAAFGAASALLTLLMMRLQLGRGGKQPPEQQPRLERADGRP